VGGASDLARPVTPHNAQAGPMFSRATAIAREVAPRRRVALDTGPLIHRYRRRRLALGAATAVALALACGAAACGGGGDSDGATELLAAGDIAECDHGGDEATARILAEHPRATIAALGDLAYQHGSAGDFARCFGPSWGRFRDRIRPATGNHDHATPQASGYAGYFRGRAGAREGFHYSYDLGAWHVVVLDSDCWRVGGCGPGDPQARWLRDDLRRHPRRCTLAYWHRPPFSSGRYGDPADTGRVRPLWKVAVAAGVDVVLTGHEHSYERFAPMDGGGAATPRGARLFVVGTGGGNLRRYRRPRLPTTRVRNDDTWGVLQLTLRPTGYAWRFLPVRGGRFADAGSGRCH
jgi:acid phosphatase type 7